MCGIADNLTKGESFAFRDIEWATRPWRRLRGLAFGRQKARILVLFPCNDVHTLGMRRSIDIAFVDESGFVVRSERNVGPAKRLRSASACMVLERYEDGDSPWPEKGDRMTICFNRIGESGRKA